jgi:hypothetical protein
MSWQITAEQVYRHPIYGEVEWISIDTMGLGAINIAAIANLFVDHKILRPVPEWIKVTEADGSLPAIAKVVVMRLKSGQEILGGYGGVYGYPRWCRAYNVTWDSKSQELMCDGFESESDGLRVTHWREV